MDFDYRLRHPFVMTCSGASQSGKSTLIKEIILRNKEVFDSKIQRVIFCHNEDEPPYASQLRQTLGGMITFQQGMDIDVEKGNTIPTIIHCLYPLSYFGIQETRA